ncbi:MAG TPA: hypothetical protein VM901_12430 [Bdellovibrionota bacterium]|jgi:hypothetical protein|nr:hypothetical protein [Bdellovibrionota bacterium]
MGGSLQAQQMATFRPYQGAATKHQIATSFASKISSFRHQNTTVSFFAPISENFSTMLAKRAWVQTPNYCRGYMDARLPSPTAGASSCQTRVERLNDEMSCLELEFPEKRYRTQSLKGYAETQLDSIEGIFQMALGPLSHLDLPSYLVDPEVYRSFQLAMWKLRYTQMQKESSALLAELSEVKSCYSQSQMASVDALVKAKSTSLERLRDYTGRLVSSSRDFNVSDRASLQRSGYCQSAYANPYLTRDDRALLSGLAGALAWRMRGEGIWKKSSTTDVREKFAGRAFVAIARFNAPESERLSDHLGSANLQRVKKGWSEWFDMGRVSGTEWSDLAGMTDRGLYQVGVGSSLTAGKSGTSGLQSSGYDSTLYKIGGLQMGACYYVAQYGLNTKEWNFGLEWRPPLVSFTHTAITWGELCAGAAMGMGLSYSLSTGPRCGSRGDLRTAKITSVRK